MNNYFDKLKKSLEFPSLNQKKRNTDSLELFFDLIFVAALSNIGHLIINPTITNYLLMSVLYFSIYMIWNNINVINFYLFDRSYFIRILIGFAMIPIIFLINYENINKDIGIITITIGFILSRITMFVINFFAIIKNDNVKNNIIINNIKITNYLFIISILFFIYPIINPSINSLITSLILSSLFELFFINTINSYKNKTKYQMGYSIKGDYELLKERHTLFLILIFGEGIISSVNAMNYNESIFYSFLIPFIIFIIVYLYFLRVYEEYLMLIYKEDNLQIMSWMHLFFGWTLLLLYSNIDNIIININNVPLISRIILILVLSYFLYNHFRLNLSILINKNQIMQEATKFKENYDFYYLDTIILFLMIVPMLLIYFTSNGYLILFYLFLYFFLHLIAEPLRYNDLS